MMSAGRGCFNGLGWVSAGWADHHDVRRAWPAPTWPPPRTPAPRARASLAAHAQTATPATAGAATPAPSTSPSRTPPSLGLPFRLRCPSLSSARRAAASAACGEEPKTPHTTHPCASGRRSLWVSCRMAAAQRLCSARGACSAATRRPILVSVSLILILICRASQVTALPPAAAATLPVNATATPFLQRLPSTPCASGGGLSLLWTGTADSLLIPLAPANQPSLATLLLPARFLQSVRASYGSHPAAPGPPYRSHPVSAAACSLLFLGSAAPAAVGLRPIPLSNL